MDSDTFAALFDEERLDRLASLADLGDLPALADLDAAHDPELAEVEVLITSWGAPTLDARRLARLPRLRAVFHAAGSVRAHVTEAFWERGILITSAADVNAVPVAEFTLAAILLAGKRALVHLRSPGAPRPSHEALARHTKVGNCGRTIGVVGFSRTGRRVVDLLRPFDGLDVVVADPFADSRAVETAGARLAPLAEVLPVSDVLTLHAPALPSTRHLIGSAQLAALPDGATLINTARGALVDHDALLRECRSGRLDAVLDVTEPEPLPADSELLRLPNVAVTPHLAGSLGTETRRLVDAALDELEAYIAGRPAAHPVDRAQLARSA
jgi:phosphoglycerate dehydrogenase-like enzyme